MATVSYQLVNSSNSSVVLGDLGSTIPAGGSVDASTFGPSLKSSLSVRAALLDGSVSFTYGSFTLSGPAAIDLLDNMFMQVTSDGKTVVTTSDRPRDYYLNMTGAGDDVTNNVIGGGPDLILTLSSSTLSATIDAKFVDNVFIKSGSILYDNAPFDTQFTGLIIVPPNTPYPVPGNGTLDLVNGQFVANTTGTGMYTTSTTEVELFRFINKMHLLGSTQQGIMALEPFFLEAPYFMRFVATVPSSVTGTVNIAINMGLYRMKTL